MTAPEAIEEMKHAAKIQEKNKNSLVSPLFFRICVYIVCIFRVEQLKRSIFNTLYRSTYLLKFLYTPFCSLSMNAARNVFL